MLNIFKKKIPTYTVTYNFDGVTYTETGTSAGIASLDADPYVEILRVVKN